MASRRIPAAARAKQRRSSAADLPSPSPVEQGEENRPEDPGDRLLIVGIGASAGGLEAFKQLLTHLPLDTGMAFVLVQHLDPDHESALTHILSRATPLPVIEITDNQPVQADHVYVIPRDTNLSIVQGLLKLEPRERTRTPHRPIDMFFESLAQDRRERVIGVVLSGTASDGTLGLEAIKAEGGITFAQDESAKHDSMPRSAVAAGCVDRVLSPADIAEELARIAKHPYIAGRPFEPQTRGETDYADVTTHQDDDLALSSGGRRTPSIGARQVRHDAEQGEKEPANGAEDGYKKIMLLLRNHSGVDFSLYRSSTIRRRITRRILITKQDRLKDYVRFLRGNREELDSLFSDVLISVTSFFRNPETFEILQREILAKLLAQHRDDPIRCWVLGCSTGQEAYSLAMSFVEAARNAPRAHTCQIFATDLNEKLLEKARQGLYAKTLAQDVSPERLRQFFVEEDGGYRISKALREMVVFARQNLLADPPFSRMDLISCRNVLIYLDPSMQQKVLLTFHYALRPNGYLLLGASESVGGFTDLFEPVDRKCKIFGKKPAPTTRFHMSARKERTERAVPGCLPPVPIGKMVLPAGVQTIERFSGELNAQREADRIVVSQFAPPAVLINDALHVLQFRGPTGAYLEPAAGMASFDVLKMAREGLMLPLRAAINKAKRENKTVRRERARVKHDGATRTIHLTVVPLKNLRERCFLVLFEEADGAKRTAGLVPLRRKSVGPLRNAKQKSRRMAELKADLSETREYLQSMQEQYEAVNEELQASNEEVQSANEELQSINEELETSKEELESANEELTTVNEEMVNRNVELHLLNSDLLNLQSSAKLAILLLGRDLTIRRFSTQAESQFHLLTTDVGRPISNLRHALGLTDGGDSPLDLETLSAEVIANVREQEREVRDKGGRWYSLCLRPYLTLDKKVDGAVLVLVDIDALKRSEQIAAAARELAENTLEAVREPLLVLDHQQRVERANRAFYSHFRVTSAETVGRRIYDLGNRQWDIPRLHELMEQIQQHRTSIEAFQVEHDFEHIGRRAMLINARHIDDPQHKTERILLAIEDVTERKRAEQGVADRTQELAQSHDRLRIMAMELNLAEQRERKRLAGELHDYLAQLLVLSCLKLGQIRRSGVSAQVETAVKEIEEVLNQALDYSRTLMAELSPPVLQEHGLAAGLKWLGEQMQRQGLMVYVEGGDASELSLPNDCAVLLFQSVRELLMNALKHASCQMVIIRLHEVENRLCIEVHDDGIGFDLTAAAAGSSTTAMSSKFGLFSIRERMIALGGWFDVQSAPGEGTTARLVLPIGGTSLASSELGVLSSELSEAVDSKFSTQNSALSSNSALSIQHSTTHQQDAKIRVLLVDDHAMVRQGLRTVLDSFADIEVVGEAWNGEEAVAATDRLRPSIVVMDINMPKMNGIEATARMKARHPEIIVIGLSVQAGGDNEAAMKEAGASRLLTKEAAMDELYQAIQQVRRPSLM